MHRFSTFFKVLGITQISLTIKINGYNRIGPRLTSRPTLKNSPWITSDSAICSTAEASVSGKGSITNTAKRRILDNRGLIAAQEHLETQSLELECWIQAYWLRPNSKETGVNRINELDLGAARRSTFTTCSITKIVKSLQRMLYLRINKALKSGPCVSVSGWIFDKSDTN